MLEEHTEIVTEYTEIVLMTLKEVVLMTLRKR